MSSLNHTPYLHATDRHCAAPQTTEQVYVAPRDDHVEEPLAAGSYLLDQLDYETPQFFYDSLAEVKVSTPAGYDPEDSSLIDEKDERAPYDKETYVASYAIKALLGDYDINSGNIQVDADGTFQPIDIDATGTRPVEYIHDNLDVDALNRASVVGRVEDADFGDEDPPEQEGFTTAIEAMADSIDLKELEDAYRADERISYDRQNLEDTTPDSDMILDEIRAEAVRDLSPAETIVRNIEYVQDGDLQGTPDQHLPLAGKGLDEMKDWIDGLTGNILQG